MSEAAPPAYRYVVGIVGALLFIGGLALAFLLFSGGEGAPGLFGGSGLGAFGLFVMIVAKDGERRETPTARRDVSTVPDAPRSCDGAP